jgi:hypothetical protein
VSKCWKQEKSNWKRDGFVQPKSAQSGCTDNVRWCARQTQANLLLSGSNQRRMAKIHRNVRCAPDCPVSQRSDGPTVGCAICARHVAEPTVGRRHRTVSVRQRLPGTNCRLRDLRETRGRANGWEGAPDCPVCTGQCPVRQRLPGANGRLRHRKKEIRTGQCPVVHWTVRCARRQKARIAFPDCSQRLLAALGL